MSGRGIVELRNGTAEAVATGSPTREQTLDVRSVATLRRQRPSLTLNDIRQVAFHKWQVAGRPSGDCVRFWLEAEQELLEGR